MTRVLLPWVSAAAIFATVSSNSCTYDPYYSSAGGYYNSGYGEGYGYGGSSFSTSVFVSTGDPRWGYDPYTYCYYDYYRRSYYDPYLYGYYPVGYRPMVVYGVPHPHGWRPGHGHCPPPQRVRNVTVVNYHHRDAAYRNSNYNWARNVRQRTDYRDGRNSATYGKRPPQSATPGTYPQTGSNPRPSMNASSGIPRAESRQPSGSTVRKSRGERNLERVPSKPEIRGNPSRLPPGYQTPVRSGRQPESGQISRPGGRAQRLESPGYPGSGPTPKNRGTAEPPTQRQRDHDRSGEAPPEKEGRKKGIRSLGDA